MAAHVFAEALQGKFRAYQGADDLSDTQQVAAVAIATGYSPRQTARHLSGECLPRHCADARRYADFFGDGNGRLMAAYRKDKLARDVAAARGVLSAPVCIILILVAAAALFGDGDLWPGDECASVVDHVAHLLSGNEKHIGHA